MEPLKHECGVALIRLRKPLQYYKDKYGSYTYALDKLYLMMEKQHNRGQEAAGAGVIKLNAPAGHELIWRERALGKDAIQKIFEHIGSQLPQSLAEMPAEEVDRYAPFIGQIYMGHLRYSTTGKSGLMYAHPVLRRNNWRSRSLMVCGNFNMTNVDRMFERVVASGQHPRMYSDTNMILEQVGFELDNENQRLYREFRNQYQEPELSVAMENGLDFERVLGNVATEWDGGFVMCGATASGSVFALRDSGGIRPAFYYCDDEVVVLASERPVIQTVFNLQAHDVNELEPGTALLIDNQGDMTVKRILPEGKNQRCSFERIYFSRGSDMDIYTERKALGHALAPRLLDMVQGDTAHTVCSFIPNTAEVAFMGMVEGLVELLDKNKLTQIKQLIHDGVATDDNLRDIMSQRVRVEKAALKDVKMRTFIAEGSSRNDLAAHVYDITYGTVKPGVDTLVIIDDSIVRGTTLRQSILRQMDRLQPSRIIVVSSSPQVRYPDYYGIDMSALDQFIAFHAAIRLLRERGKESVIHDTYRACLAQRNLPDSSRVNCVKAIYEPFTDEEVSQSIVDILTQGADEPFNAKIDILYQTLDDMHRAIPNHPGDWYFSGDYPTQGGNRLVNEAYIDWYEKNI